MTRFWERDSATFNIRAFHRHGTYSSPTFAKCFVPDHSPESVTRKTHLLFMENELPDFLSGPLRVEIDFIIVNSGAIPHA